MKTFHSVPHSGCYNSKINEQTAAAAGAAAVCKLLSRQISRTSHRDTISSQMRASRSGARSPVHLSAPADDRPTIMKLQRRHGLKVVFLIGCACLTSLVVLFNKIHKMSTETTAKPPFPTPRSEPKDEVSHVTLVHAAIYSANVTGLPSSALHMLVMSDNVLQRKESFKCNSYTTSSGMSTDVTITNLTSLASNRFIFKFICDVVEDAEWITLEQPGFSLPIRFAKPPAHGETNAISGCVSPLLFFDDTTLLATIYDNFRALAVPRIDQFVLNLHANTFQALRTYAGLVNFQPWTLDLLNNQTTADLYSFEYSNETFIESVQAAFLACMLEKAPYSSIIYLTNVASPGKTSAFPNKDLITQILDYEKKENTMNKVILQEAMKEDESVEIRSQCFCTNCHEIPECSPLSESNLEHRNVDHIELSFNVTESIPNLGSVNGTDFYQAQIASCLEKGHQKEAADPCRIQLRKQNLFCYAAQTNFFHAKFKNSVFYAPRMLSFAQFIDGCHF